MRGQSTERRGPSRARRSLEDHDVVLTKLDGEAWGRNKKKS